jgi:hypothetical protein
VWEMRNLLDTRYSFEQSSAQAGSAASEPTDQFREMPTFNLE